jgi:hypothetical protein
LRLLAESFKHRSTKSVKGVFARGFSRRDLHDVAFADSQYAAANGHMVLFVLMIAPSDHRHRQDGDEIRMSWKDPEGASFVFGADVAHILGIHDD